MKEKPFKIDAERLFSMPLVIAVALAGALVGATLAWAGVINRQEAQRQVLDDTTALVKDNVQRIGRLERTTAADITEIKTDVKWIKVVLAKNLKIDLLDAK